MPEHRSAVEEALEGYRAAGPATRAAYLRYFSKTASDVVEKQQTLNRRYNPSAEEIWNNTAETAGSALAMLATLFGFMAIELEEKDTP